MRRASLRITRRNIESCCLQWACSEGSERCTAPRKESVPKTGLPAVTERLSAFRRRRWTRWRTIETGPGEASSGCVPVLPPVWAGRCGAPLSDAEKLLLRVADEERWGCIAQTVKVKKREEKPENRVSREPGLGLPSPGLGRSEREQRERVRSARHWRGGVSHLSRQ